MNLSEEPAVAIRNATDRLTSRQWQVALLCALVAICDGFDAQAIAFVAPVISKQWGIAASQFGTVFSAGLIGMSLGAFLQGSISDRLGRKVVILACVTLFGIASILTASASSMVELAGWRVITGLGLGGVLPNLVALTNEVATARQKNALVILMFCGFPVGATIGGLIAAPLIGAAGWTAVFLLGGIVPLCLLPLLYRFLPRSTAADPAPSHESPIDPAMVARTKVAGLFREGRTIPTLLFWATFFSNLMVMYFLVNWLPSLLSLGGASLSVATLSTALLNLGGVGGAVLFSRVANGRTALSVLAAGYLAGSIALVLIARAEGNIAVLLSAAALAGAVVVGGQIAMNAVTSSFYPAAIRATGVGWALGIGRIGSIAGPLVGGALMKSGWQGTSSVLFAVIPMLLAATALFSLKRYVHNHAGSDPIG
jgi:MFS transporter, AAHS family, 4-hydroxybenzoate transporter